MKGAEESKRSKLSKRVSKLKSDSKSSSAFHSSLNSSNVHRHASHNIFSTLVHLLAYEVLQRDFDIEQSYVSTTELLSTQELYLSTAELRN